MHSRGSCMVLRYYMLLIKEEVLLGNFCRMRQKESELAISQFLHLLKSENILLLILSNKT